MAAAALAAACPGVISAATPSPLLHQVERILVDCKVVGSAAASAVGRSLCDRVMSEVRLQSAVPVVLLGETTSFDPLSDLTLNVVASLSHSSQGSYQLALSVRAARRGFPATASARRAPAEIAVDASGRFARAHALIADSLRPLLSASPTRKRIPPPGARS